MTWPVEQIPDGDQVYCRIHRNNAPNYTGAFRFRSTDSLSVDWSKYSTPQETRDRANSPKDNGVVSFHVGEVKAKLSDSRVEHQPVQRINRAHSGIVLPGSAGKKILQTKAKAILWRIKNWEIPVD